MTSDSRPRRASDASVLSPLLMTLLVGACASQGVAASAPVAAPSAPPSVATPPPAPPPPPPPATASDVLAGSRAPFDACYALARKTRPDLGRTSVEILFSMDDSGKLYSVELTYRNRMDDAAKDCMRKAAEAMTFPPALRGKQTGTIVFTPP